MLNALKNLYVKLGGALSDTYAGIEGGKPVGDYILKTDLISACAEKAGGGGIFKVDFLIHDETVTASKTVKEINAAFAAGKTVIGILTDDGDKVLQLVGAGIGDEGGFVNFNVVMDDGDGHLVTVSISGILTIEEEQETEAWSMSTATIVTDNT